MDEAKQALRAEMKARLQALEPAELDRVADRLAKVVLGSAPLQNVSRLLLYAATANELPTRPLFEQARASGLRCAFPRCVEGDRLEFIEVDGWLALEPGRFGILEPPALGSRVAPGAGDVVLVPGLAFTEAGERLGRGGGFYDRTFSASEGGAAPFLIGFGHPVQRVDRIPCGELDRRMDAIATEEGLLSVP